MLLRCLICRLQRLQLLLQLLPLALHAVSANCYCCHVSVWRQRESNFRFAVPCMLPK
jgi:hypothetical protein